MFRGNVYSPIYLVSMEEGVIQSNTVVLLAPQGRDGPYYIDKFECSAQG